MNVVQPPSTEAAITSLLLVHIQTDLAVRFPSRPLAILSDVDRVINGLVLFTHGCATRAAISMVKTC
jgi:hypothetical protein